MSPVVEQARATEGCVDLAHSADLLDPSRIDVFEKWRARTHWPLPWRWSSRGQNDALRHFDVRESRVEG